MIVRVYVQSYQELERVSSKYLLDIADGHAGEYYDIVADHEMFNKIISSGLTYEVIVHSLEYEKEKVRADYLSYTETNDSLRQFVQNFPSICKFDSLPIPTYQGNWLYGVKISDNPHIEEEREAGFLVDGLHHSREWACIPVVMFFADSMLRGYNNVPEITEIINNTEIYCFPIINADGYLYDYPTGRMWRLNREPFRGRTGTDPNRNYAGCAPDIAGDWGAVALGGATHYPGQETFCGAYANSGDETRALTLYVRDRICNLNMSYHSYGEMILWGWGWTTQPTPDDALHVQIGNRIANMIGRLGGGSYRRGQIPIILYEVSGSSIDWFYSWCHYVSGIANLSFGTELGTSFYQPIGDLDDIIHENFKALKYLAHFADSVVLLTDGRVAPPEIYPLGTVNEDFAVSWHPVNKDENNPTHWELVELSNPSVIEDDLESGTGRWVLNGFSWSTSQAHSGVRSLFSGNTNRMNSAVQTVHPYLIESGDSVTFWCWYNLETDYDVAVAEVSENGRYWFNLDTMRFSGNSGGWQREAFSLENWVDKSVYIRFRSMTDRNTLGSGFYVDDISPTCLFANVDIISSSIPDTFYQFTGHPTGEYYYYARGNNTMWGWGEFSCLKKANVIVGIAESQNPKEVAKQPFLSLSPNPFKRRTNISYQIGDHGSHVSDNRSHLRIYDASGSLVKSFNDLTIQPFNQIVWDGCDELGKALPAGVYFVHFETRDYKKVEKAILLR
jgi:hypothetical protein